MIKMPDENRIWKVSEITFAIKEILEESFLPIWLTGEIGNLTVHRSGHVYFTMKDKTSQIKVVFFGGAPIARQLKLEEGAEIEAYGKLMVYEPRGNYQFNIKEIRKKGVGELQQQFERLKQQLKDEGLFEQNRKKNMPFLPRCIGVVTSPDGAALHDFLRILNQRFSGMHVRIVPAAVQGIGAAAEIVRGIEFLNKQNCCDVIVVTRGGGSLEDLWAFNEEIVARAVAASKIPVISAVGHEVDFTICDFVADLRVPTPSAAAEFVVRGKTELAEKLVLQKKRLANGMRLNMSLTRSRVERLANHYILREPMNLVRMFQQRVDESILRINQTITLNLNQYRDRFQRSNSQLRTLNPHNVLGRGYAIILAKDGNTPVVSSDHVEKGDTVTGILAQGNLKLIVDDKDITP